MADAETIFALASAAGKAGVSVIRVSGPMALQALEQLGSDIPAPRVLSLRNLVDLDGEPLDQALVAYFPKGSSFTGEDVVELHVHGSVAVISDVLGALAKLPDFRMADAGEFTRRALENGCMDLSQVEGLADLIEAETSAQKQQAQRLLDGSLRDTVDRWRTDLIRAAALLEATIDFADEEVPVDVTPEVTALISNVLELLVREIQGVSVAERIRSGFEVAIVGSPNVGKSTLLNALARREAAITSEFAGTTRDVIEVRMDLDGLPVTLLDTAGLRDTQDHVEKIGIKRALEKARTADLRIFLLDDDERLPIQPQPGDIVRLSKGDLRSTTDRAISGKSGEGVDVLVQDVSKILKNRASSVGVAVRFRHLAAMERGHGSLTQALDLLNIGPDGYEIVAEELRSSIRALDALIGRVDVENLLDEIFSSFCVGK